MQCIYLVSWSIGTDLHVLPNAAVKQSAKVHGPLVEIPTEYDLNIKHFYYNLNISKFQTEHFMDTTIRSL